MFKGLKKVLKVYPLPIFVILLTFVIYYFAFEAVNKNTHKTDAITEEESMLNNEQQVLAQSATQEAQISQTITPETQESQEAPAQELAQNEIEPLPEPQTILLVTSRVKSLNIRQAPQTTAQVVGKLTPAQNAIVLEEQNGWLKIANVLDSKELGWILKEYSKEIKQEIAQIPQEPQKAESLESQTTQTLEIPQNTDSKETNLNTQKFSTKVRVNIREIPSTNGNIVGKLTPEDTIIILEEKDGWAKITSDNGDKSGFVVRRALILKEN